MKIPKDVEDLRGHLYGAAEKLWWSSFWVALGVQLLMVATLWRSEAWVVSMVALTALAAPIVIAWFRESAKTKMTRADKCRRLILYADGLGRSITSEELSEVRAWGMGSKVKDANFIAPYYTSQKPVGPNRLADIVAESAFFTFQLSQRVIEVFSGVLLLSFGLVIAVLFMSDILTVLGKQANSEPIINIAKSSALVIAFLLSADFVLLFKGYFDLRSIANETFRRCVSLRDREALQESQMLWIVEDYNIAVIQSPPIPGFFYRKYKDELNRIYRESHS